MTEQEILEDLAARTGLLEPRANKDEQRERVAKFTRMGAWLLRQLGWGNVKKLGGAQVQGKSVDKVIHRETGVVVDVVAKSDGPTEDDPKPPRVIWLSVDQLDPDEFFIEPTNADGAEPEDKAPTPTEPEDDDLALLLAAYSRVVDGLDKVSDGIHQLLARIDELQKTGVKVRLG